MGCICIMDTDIVQAVARYAEETMGHESFRYVNAVVANCKMLALELETLEENPVAVDMEALVIAAYLHDISTVAHGYQNHHLKSAEMAGGFLRKQGMDAKRMTKVEQAILIHTKVVPAKLALIEGKIL